MKQKTYKQFIKKKIQHAAFVHLEILKNSQSKLKNIKYTNLEPQKYFKSYKFTWSSHPAMNSGLWVLLCCAIEIINIYIKGVKQN